MSGYSAAQDRAARKYKSANLFNIQVAFNKKYDQEIIDFLNTKPSKATYIKELIKADLAREKK